MFPSRIIVDYLHLQILISLKRRENPIAATNTLVRANVLDVDAVVLAVLR